MDLAIFTRQGENIHGTIAIRGGSIMAVCDRCKKEVVYFMEGKK